MTTEEKFEIAAGLMKRAIEISDKTEHDVFCEFSPHVNYITVDIHQGGWKKNQTGTIFEIDLDAKDDAALQLIAVNATLDSLEG